MERHVFPVPGHRHTGQVTVHGRTREHESAVGRGALGLVDRRRVAVIEGAEPGRVDLDRIVAAAGTDPHLSVAEGLDRTGTAVPDPEPTVVLQEHDPVADGEGTLTGSGLDHRFGFREGPSFPQPGPDQPVQGLDIGAPVRQRQPGFFRMIQGVHRVLRRQGNHRILLAPAPGNVAGPVVQLQAITGLVPRKQHRCPALPVRLLSADFRERRHAAALGERPEGRAGADRLQLFSIPEQDGLRPAALNLLQYG